MNNIELKKKLWKRIRPEILKEIGSKYEVSVKDLEKDTKYFHPVVKINPDINLEAQCDVSNEGYYAVSVKSTIEEHPFSHLEFELTRNSFKKAINIVQRNKISVSILQTVKEIKLLQQNIENTKELIYAKTILIKSKSLSKVFNT